MGGWCGTSSTWVGWDGGWRRMEIGWGGGGRGSCWHCCRVTWERLGAAAAGWVAPPDFAASWQQSVAGVVYRCGGSLGQRGRQRAGCWLRRRATRSPPHRPLLALRPGGPRICQHPGHPLVVCLQVPKGRKFVRPAKKCMHGSMPASGTGTEGQVGTVQAACSASWHSSDALCLAGRNSLTLPTNSPLGMSRFV